MINLKVAKPDYIQKADDVKKSKFEGEINGYNERLQHVHKTAKEALKTLQIKETAITDEDAKIARVESNLNELDTSRLVVAMNWSVSKEWKSFRTLTESFDLHSQWDVQKVTKWTNGTCEWAEYTESNNIVKGKLVGKFS